VDGLLILVGFVPLRCLGYQGTNHIYVHNSTSLVKGYNDVSTLYESSSGMQ